MIEVFRTNVTEAGDAEVVLRHIQSRFVLYEANFDLQDCDRVLRIKSILGDVDTKAVISLLAAIGFEAGVLDDVVPVTESELEDHTSSRG